MEMSGSALLPLVATDDVLLGVGIGWGFGSGSVVARQIINFLDGIKV